MDKYVKEAAVGESNSAAQNMGARAPMAAILPTLVLIVASLYNCTAIYVYRVLGL